MSYSLVDKSFIPNYSFFFLFNFRSMRHRFHRLRSKIQRNISRIIIENLRFLDFFFRKIFNFLTFSKLKIFLIFFLLRFEGLEIFQTHFLKLFQPRCFAIVPLNLNHCHSVLQHCPKFDSYFQFNLLAIRSHDEFLYLQQRQPHISNIISTSFAVRACGQIWIYERKDSPTEIKIRFRGTIEKLTFQKSVIDSVLNCWTKKIHFFLFIAPLQRMFIFSR